MIVQEFFLYYNADLHNCINDQEVDGKTLREDRENVIYFFQLQMDD